MSTARRNKSNNGKKLKNTNDHKTNNRNQEFTSFQNQKRLPGNDLTIYLLARYLKGNEVQILTTKSRIEGVLHSFDHNVLLMKQVMIFDSNDTISNVKESICFKEVPIKDINIMKNLNVNGKINVDNVLTDSDISQKKTVTKGPDEEKDFVPYFNEHDHKTNDDVDLATRNCKGWIPEEMLKVNKEKFKLESTFKESMEDYTTKIDTSDPNLIQKMEKAERLARDIENDISTRKTQHLEDDDDFDNEEHRFSAANPILASSVANETKVSSISTSFSAVCLSSGVSSSTIRKSSTEAITSAYTQSVTINSISSDTIASNNCSMSSNTQNDSVAQSNSSSLTSSSTKKLNPNAPEFRPKSFQSQSTNQPATSTVTTNISYQHHPGQHARNVLEQQQSIPQQPEDNVQPNIILHSSQTNAPGGLVNVSSPMAGPYSYFQTSVNPQLIMSQHHQQAQQPALTQPQSLPGHLQQPQQHHQQSLQLQHNVAHLQQQTQSTGPTNMDQNYLLTQFFLQHQHQQQQQAQSSQYGITGVNTTISGTNAGGPMAQPQSQQPQPGGNNRPQLPQPVVVTQPNMAVSGHIPLQYSSMNPQPGSQPQSVPQNAQIRPYVNYSHPLQPFFHPQAQHHTTQTTAGPNQINPPVMAVTQHMQHTNSAPTQPSQQPHPHAPTQLAYLQNTLFHQQQHQQQQQMHNPTNVASNNHQQVYQFFLPPAHQASLYSQQNTTHQNNNPINQTITQTSGINIDPQQMKPNMNEFQAAGPGGNNGPVMVTQHTHSYMTAGVPPTYAQHQPHHPHHHQLTAAQTNQPYFHQQQQQHPLANYTGQQPPPHLIGQQQPPPPPSQMISQSQFQQQTSNSGNSNNAANNTNNNSSPNNNTNNNSNNAPSASTAGPGISNR